MKQMKSSQAEVPGLAEAPVARADDRRNMLSDP